ncbi:hypothetical protein NDU88_002451 [Pleurodeles waltl]|uniref:Uncharacterized protein n=1 Tax=Pleurodeles waltl TaxID=8319 RepID=A0AAV7MVR1_PLEWA|nr:hypothetical protein NDU88_002451 [Pleurodeles waltl]
METANLTMGDMVSEEFLSPPLGQANETTKVTWASSGVVNQVPEVFVVFLAWRIQILQDVKPAYQCVLMSHNEKCVTHSPIFAVCKTNGSKQVLQETFFVQMPGAGFQVLRISVHSVRATHDGNLQICSWNINCLLENFADKETLSYMLTFNIIMLQETWAEKVQPIPGYISYTVPAAKEALYGYLRGGQAIFFHAALQGSHTMKPAV